MKNCSSPPCNSSMFTILRDIKEPPHYSKRVGHRVPGVVVWPCCGQIPLIGITSGILPFHFNSIEINKVDMSMGMS